MPANRSRTDRWRDCLQQIHARGGAIEITPDPGEPDDAGPRQTNLIWRVQLSGLADDALVVEQPTALGRTIELTEGTRLVGAMTIGQNRWMFRTRVLGALPRAGGRGGAEAGRACVRLALPSDVERCQRRNFYRMSTLELALPEVECWPLLDPATVVAAEVANRAQIADAARSGAGAGGDPAVLPEVGPRFCAHLVNIGGGGAGLVLETGASGALDRARLFWMRIDLRPQIPLPIGVTARLAHTHLDSAQNVYAGMAFDFAFNPPHRDFVVDQICGYVKAVQRRAAA